MYVRYGREILYLEYFSICFIVLNSYDYCLNLYIFFFNFVGIIVLWGFLY